MYEKIFVKQKIVKPRYLQRKTEENNLNFPRVFPSKCIFHFAFCSQEMEFNEDSCKNTKLYAKLSVHS